MSPVEILRGNSPIVLGQPHSGTFLPDEVREALNEPARQLLDTDWRIPELYEGLVEGATIVRANFSRYVIDANRPPDGASLYPGQNTTGLVPLEDFDGKSIWHREPGEDEIANRLARFHRPYHTALAQELERIRSIHGFALLYDCHSIRSTAPYLFDGTLPDFNIGTNLGTSCAPVIEQAVARVCEASDFSSVLNGRFKGGWTTRHYGRPEASVHAIQMEIAQSAYLESEAPPFAITQEKSERLRAVLADVFTAITIAFGELK